MLPIPRTSLSIPPTRQRLAIDPQQLQDLVESISRIGLLHAPVVRPGLVEGEWILVAGERRLTAIDQLHATGTPFSYNGMAVDPDHIPVTALYELDELGIVEAELEENIRRVDLTWQEQAAATKKFHELRGLQKQFSADASEPPPRQTVADTASEVYPNVAPAVAHDKTRQDLILARHLDNPNVAKAKTAKEAFKILKAEDTRESNRQLAATVGKTFTSEKHQLFNSSWESAFPIDCFDVILTDPPYGMGADQFGDGGDGRLVNADHQYDDSYESWQALMRGWCAHAYRAAKPQAHAYVFCDIDRFHELRDLMAAAGWDVFRTPLIVHKTDSGRVPRPEHGPRRQWEMILYAIKGRKPVTKIYGDVIPTQGDPNLQHGAQKPVALFQNLLQRSVKPGDVVADFFAGTGPLIPAAHALQCTAWVWEINPEHYAKCVNRVRTLKELEEKGI